MSFETPPQTNEYTNKFADARNIRNIQMGRLTCAQRRLKSACASAQSDQSLRCLREDILHPWQSKMRPVEILIRLRECAGWSESSLRAQICECTLFDGAAHIKCKINKISVCMWHWHACAMCKCNKYLANFSGPNNLLFYRLAECSFPDM